MRKHLLLLAVATIVLLMLNGVATLLGYAPLSHLNENRILAQAPNWKGNLTQFVRDTDAYVTDNFAFRKPLLAGYNSILYWIFRSTFARGVIIGEDGWVFAQDFDAQRLSGPPKLSQSYLEAVRLSLIERRDWLAERNSRLVVMFMPSKTNMYGPRFLPAPLRHSRDPIPSEQLHVSLGPELNRNYVALKARLDQASEERPTHYYTDHHANHLGSKAAIDALVAHIHHHYSDRRPQKYPDIEDKVDVHGQTSFGGLMGVPLRDFELVPVPKGGYSASNREPPAYKEFAPRNSVARYLGNDKAPPVSVVLIGDSFTDRLAPHLAEVFGKTDVLYMNRVPDLADQRFPTAFLENARPDYVVLSYVESRLAECPDQCFSLKNTDDVRQARLRRIFRDARELNGANIDSSLYIAKFDNKLPATVHISTTARSSAMRLEMDRISLLSGEQGYLFLSDPMSFEITSVEPLNSEAAAELIGVQVFRVPMHASF